MLTYSSESMGFSLSCPGCGKAICTFPRSRVAHFRALFTKATELLVGKVEIGRSLPVLRHPPQRACSSLLRMYGPQNRYDFLQI
jgi:hypothetical protein